MNRSALRRGKYANRVNPIADTCYSTLNIPNLICVYRMRIRHGTATHHDAVSVNRFKMAALHLLKRVVR